MQDQCLGKAQTKCALPSIMDQREKCGFIFQLYKLLEVERGKGHYTVRTLVPSPLSVCRIPQAKYQGLLEKSNVESDRASFISSFYILAPLPPRWQKS